MTKILTDPNRKHNDKISVYVNLKFDFGMVEDTVEKGENAGKQRFLLFPQCFQTFSFPAW